MDRRFARLLLDLTGDRPELVALQDVRRDQPLITQGQANDSVYLVLSGRLQVYCDGELVEALIKTHLEELDRFALAKDIQRHLRLEDQASSRCEGGTP